MNILGNTLALLLVLSVLVVVHEFGHFALAKAFRFPVEVFSFGFGKRLFGKTVNGTDYRVSALPLGGYVRVVGLGPDESTVAEGTSTQAAPVGKRWQRALILLAGPAMNLVLAFVLYAATFALGTRVPAYELQPPVIGVVEPASPGAEAGFQRGDRIVSINGTATPRWRDALFVFAMNAREHLSVLVDRGGERVATTVTPRANNKYDMGYVGLLPDFGRSVHPRVERVIRGGPADRAGIKPGDVIVSIGGRAITGGPTEIFDTFVAAVRQAAPGPFPVELQRDGKTLRTAVTPRKEGDAWRVEINVGPDVPEVVEKFPVGESVVESWRRVKTDVRMTLSVLGRLFRGRASIRTMSGPLDIAKFSGEAARTGAVPLLALMAAISLQLGIFNLLPIPVLDGGHLFLLGIESAARRDFSLRVKERILQLGFLMILALLSVVIYNDLAKNLPAKWWPF